MLLLYFTPGIWGDKTAFKQKNEVDTAGRQGKLIAVSSSHLFRNICSFQF